MKNTTELEYLNLCKKSIETQLRWQESSHWKQRDYLNLIELIENKTGITLSLSTIKRIWAANYKGIPHPSTLDAFAQFSDYSNWLDFKAKNRLTEFKEQAKTSLLSLPFIVLISILSLTGLVFIGYHFSIVETPQKKLSFNPDKVEFSCKNSVANGVPNTIIFDYDVSEIDADSFFIQQKWNSNTRYKIDKEKNQFTTIYYIPGYHKAKLVANDSIIKEIDIRINTNEWLALIRESYFDNFPRFVSKNKLISNGVLHASEELLRSNKIDVNNQTITSYFYINKFDKKVSSGEFEFETRLRCDSIFNFTCPYISVMLVGQGMGHFISLVKKGCVGEASLKIGDSYINGKTNDLSVFGVNVFEWQKLKLSVKNKKAQIFINNNKVYELNFKTDVGEISGISLHFLGTGVVDYVKLWDDSNNLVFEDNF